ncbi:MAG: anti-sigma factor [Nitrospirae bacterium]|nr:anti-sigma factor [Nitrospirota bacterium]
MSHEQFEESVPLYAVGALEKAERQVLEVHLLSGCTACHAALKSYSAVAGLLPYGLPPHAAPAELKGRIMEALPKSQTRTESSAAPVKIQEPARSWLADLLEPGGLRPSWGFNPAVSLAAVLIATGAVLYSVYLRSQVTIETGQIQRVQMMLQEENQRIAAAQQQLTAQHQELSALRDQVGLRTGEVEQLKAELASREEQVDQLQTHVAQQAGGNSDLRKALAQRDEILALLRSPDVKVVSFACLHDAKAAGGFILFDRSTQKALFYAFNMPALPPDKTYQLWAILDKPVSAGVFQPDQGQKTRGMVRGLPDPAKITKFAVSVEPSGGRLQPTGAIYLMGQL